MRDIDRYLEERGRRWFYVRRVPSEFADIDPRGRVRVALRTSSIEIARVRRDAMAEADNHYWASLSDVAFDSEIKLDGQHLSAAQQRYKAASRRAIARGFVYTAARELVETAPTEEIVERLVQVAASPDLPKADAEALLGTAPVAVDTISQAMQVFENELATDALLHKSPAQKMNYLQPKHRAVSNFISVCGDLPMNEIERKHGQDFYAWWKDRIDPELHEKPLSADSANRDLGNLRFLFREYWQYQGEEGRENPFRNLRFKNVVYKSTPPFSDSWVRSRILVPNMFDGINREAALITLALIETGCRPSELANLQPKNIRLEDSVPHLKITPVASREIKTLSSEREIPLVGVSFEAMKRAPAGFPKYRDRETTLSNILMKAFRVRSLLETDDHRIYSFRHAFEKRMLEADIDYGLRCLLMGHKTDRPSYGDGGSLSYRRQELEKIAHPVSDALRGWISAL